MGWKWVGGGVFSCEKSFLFRALRLGWGGNVSKRAQNFSFFCIKLQKGCGSFRKVSENRVFFCVVLEKGRNHRTLLGYGLCGCGGVLK